jgi:hypothetical protein
MKTASTWNLRSLSGKILMGLVLTAMIGSIGVAPAYGKDDRGKGKHKGHYEQKRHDDDDDRYAPRRVYRERVYAPPRVIYAPPRPPGIGIFFPPIYIHP